MSQIEVSIYDQTAVFTNTPDIFSGDIDTDTVKFKFDSSWNTFDDKTAIFYNEPKKSYPVILNDTHTAVIPSNVIDRKTTMYFGVIGTKADGSVKTSNILSYRIENGAITADTEIPPSSAEVWLQILANYEFALKKLNEMSNNLENMNGTLEEMDQRFIDAGVENKANKDLSNVDVLGEKVISTVYPEIEFEQIFYGSVSASNNSSTYPYDFSKSIANFDYIAVFKEDQIYIDANGSKTNCTYGGVISAVCTLSDILSSGRYPTIPYDNYDCIVIKSLTQFKSSASRTIKVYGIKNKLNTQGG